MEEQENDPIMERAIRYVENDMDVVERAAFEQEVATDPAMQENLTAVRSTISALKDLGVERLRKELGVADAELNRSGMPATWHKWWWAAAAVVLLGGLGWWLMPRETPQALADHYAIREEGLPVLMGGDPRVLDAMMNAYKQDDLATADLLLGQALLQDPTNDTLLYFTGVVLDREKKYPQAIAAYAQVPGSSVFAIRAIYRSAICALEENNTDQARVLLQRVAAGTDAQFSERAEELLERLSRL
ncbi:MAG: tetratricopeptide repeat protein [Flavobacteriales bacterium]